MSKMAFADLYKCLGQLWLSSKYFENPSVYN